MRALLGLVLLGACAASAPPPAVVPRVAPALALATAADSTWQLRQQYASTMPMLELWTVAATVDDEVLGLCLFAVFADGTTASLLPMPLRDPGFSQPQCDRAYAEWLRRRP